MPDQPSVPFWRQYPKFTALGGLAIVALAADIIIGTNYLERVLTAALAALAGV